MSQMTEEEVTQRSKVIVDFLTDLNAQATEAGIDQSAHFYTTVAYTLGSLIGLDFKPVGYGPMFATILESLTDGLQVGAQAKGVEATFIKIVRD
ncbi:hypothetical protein JJQ72_02120 [Paenibacillus sp. F411]|uniref:hypothetical protein n=1 Tax=Paenibacillus sp. F411 TaxID=2820239 RepID=UPI001AAF9013|nr:hypothetical protein [Paenibacillus sp. F411]MBO2942781.1 hypothetical protein [Paenibacillus sp. F411]